MIEILFIVWICFYIDWSSTFDNISRFIHLDLISIIFILLILIVVKIKGVI